MRKFLIILILIFLVGCGKKEAPINTEVKLAVREVPEVKTETKQEQKVEAKQVEKPVAKKAAPVSVDQPIDNYQIHVYVAQ